VSTFGSTVEVGSQKLHCLEKVSLIMVVLLNGCTSDCVNCHYPGTSGRVGAGSSLGAERLLENVQDPREAVLKYAKVGYSNQVRWVCHPSLSMSVGDSLIPRPPDPAVGTVA